MVLTIAKPLDWARFEEWLQLLLWEKRYPSKIHNNDSGNCSLTGHSFDTLEVLRLKGILSLDNTDRMVILQGVGDLYDTNTLGPWAQDAGAVRESRVLFIGRNMDRQKLFDSLSRHMEEPDKSA